MYVVGSAGILHYGLTGAPTPAWLVAASVGLFLLINFLFPQRDPAPVRERVTVTPVEETLPDNVIKFPSPKHA